MSEVYAIWHQEKHDRISDNAVIVGIVLAPWPAPEEIVDKLNMNDTEKGFSFDRNYWHESFPVLTPDNCLEGQ